ncbi:DNA adenine methylase [Coraliomargarita sp. W4R53]
MQTISPLRYPGGKTMIVPFLKDILERNDLVGGTYIEPYAGGAGAALKLLDEGAVSRIILNDYSPIIGAFWRALLRHSKLFMARFEETEPTIEEWHRQKEIVNRYREFNLVDVGFAAFYLNRCNRSGVLNAGPIGGLDQTGNYKIDARYSKLGLRSRLEKVISMRRRITFRQCDALDFLVEINQMEERRALIYLDPPYYVKGQKLYLNAYQHQDHHDLCYFLGDMRTPWLLSYDNVEVIRRLYRDYPQYSFELSYRVNKAKIGSEFLTHSADLAMPNTMEIRRSKGAATPIAPLIEP